MSCGIFAPRTFGPIRSSENVHHWKKLYGQWSIDATEGFPSCPKMRFDTAKTAWMRAAINLLCWRKPPSIWSNAVNPETTHCFCACGYTQPFTTGNLCCFHPRPVDQVTLFFQGTLGYDSRKWRTVLRNTGQTNIFGAPIMMLKWICPSAVTITRNVSAAGSTEKWDTVCGLMLKLMKRQDV